MGAEDDAEAHEAGADAELFGLFGFLFPGLDGFSEEVVGGGGGCFGIGCVL